MCGREQFGSVHKTAQRPKMLSTSYMRDLGPHMHMMKGGFVLGAENDSMTGGDSAVHHALLSVL
jgi:hypothetical protein